MNRPGNWKLGLVLAGLTLLTTLIVGEVYLRAAGSMKTYSESNFGEYTSYYNQLLPDWFHRTGPNIRKPFDAVEFDFEYASNSEGVRDHEHTVDKPEGTFRIVTLGDSFTEGVGAAFEDTWFNVLERSLQQKGLPVEVLNAGASGSDIFYNFTMLKYNFLKYHPDLVLVLVNDSDITDYMFRGGMERFLESGSTRFRKGPWFEPIYQHSHLARLIMRVFLGIDHQVMVPRKRLEELQRQARTAITDAAEGYRELADQHGFDLLVVFHPTPGNVVYGTYPFTGEDVEAVQQHGVDGISVLPAFDGLITRTNYEEYAWPIDYHFKAKGYKVLAEAIEARIPTTMLPSPTPP